MSHGCTPVKLTLKLALPPAQMFALPLNVAVGTGDTCTTALPDPTPVQAMVVTEVRVNVFVAAGLTLMLYGLAAIPLMVTGIVPSVYTMLHGCVP